MQGPGTQCSFGRVCWLTQAQISFKTPLRTEPMWSAEEADVI